MAKTKKEEKALKEEAQKVVDKLTEQELNSITTYIADQISEESNKRIAELEEQLEKANSAVEIANNEAAKLSESLRVQIRKTDGLAELITEITQSLGLVESNVYKTAALFGVRIGGKK